jgi:hypothetical protein
VRRGALRVPRLLREGARSGSSWRCSRSSRSWISRRWAATSERSRRSSCSSLPWSSLMPLAAADATHRAPIAIVSHRRRDCPVRRVPHPPPAPVRARRHVGPSGPACPVTAEALGEDRRRYVPNRAAACRRATSSGSSRLELTAGRPVRLAASGGPPSSRHPRRPHTSSIRAGAYSRRLDWERLKQLRGAAAPLSLHGACIGHRLPARLDGPQPGRGLRRRRARGHGHRRARGDRL